MEARRRALELLDVYGRLLTQQQAEATRLHLAEDWSYAEIAASQGVTRAAVYDTVRRAQAAMEGYEDKLGLLAASGRREEERLAVQARLDGLEVELRSLRRAVKGLT